MVSLSTGVPLADRYLLIERLGAGGMSVVWRGFDDVLGRAVAIKVLAAPIAEDPVFRAVIQREARAAARIAHPHLTHIYDYGEATMPGGQLVPYVVMELLDGQTLTERLRSGPLPWPAAVRLCAQVADGLAAAHRRGIVHRDVAPANIMLTHTGAKVLDFGIAALAGGRGDPEGGTLLGTPAYTAPERLDDAPAAPAADVYGLGALLYESLSGRPPLPARTWAALVEAYRAGTEIAPLEVAGLPPRVARLCQRCLDPDPAARPGSAEVARLLAAVLAPTTVDGVILAQVDAIPWPDTRPIDDTGPGTRRLAGLVGRPVPVRSRRHFRRMLSVGGLILAVLVPVVLAVQHLDRPTPRTQPTPQTQPAPGPATSPLPPLTPSPNALGPSPTSPATNPATIPVTHDNLQVVQQLINLVAAGRSAGKIRADTALDLTNVLGNLRTALLDGGTVNLIQVTALQTKIDDRVREGAILHPYDRTLPSTVDTLDTA